MKKGLLSLVAISLFLFAGYQNCSKAPQTYDDGSECQDCGGGQTTTDPLQITIHVGSPDSNQTFSDVNPFVPFYVKLFPNVGWDTVGCADLSPANPIVCTTPVSTYSSHWTVLSDGTFLNSAASSGLFQTWGFHGQRMYNYFKRRGDQNFVSREYRIQSAVEVDPATIPANTYFHWYSSDAQGRNRITSVSRSQAAYSNVYMLFGAGPNGALGTAELCIQVVGAENETGQPCVNTEGAATRAFTPVTADNFANDNVGGRASHYNNSTAGWLAANHTRILSYSRKNGVIRLLSDVSVTP